MSLSYDDLQAIRKVVEETVDPIKGELEALGNDIKEIYEMISSSQKSPEHAIAQKRSLEEKILELHSELVEAAKQAGVRLPSH
jgi:peptidoglycan hydrolase CwlO-like protein